MSEKDSAILEQRARRLARPVVKERSATESIEVVTFDLASEHYAIESRFVVEIARLIELTPIPGAPDFFAGVVNLRGEILAVVDLCKLLGLSPQRPTDLTRLLVLGTQRADLGILADFAHEVTPVRRDELLDPAAAVTGLGRELLRGVTRQGVLVLDGGLLLRDERLFVGGIDPPAGAARDQGNLE